MEVETVSNTSESTEKIRQKGKTVRTLLIIALVIVVLSTPLWLCGGCAAITALLPGGGKDNGPTKVDNNGSTADTTQSDTTGGTETENTTPQKFGIGEDVQLDDYVMQVATLEDPYTSTDEYSQPESGNRFVAVEVVYNNASSGSTVSYNPNDWTLFDGEGYSFSYSWMAQKEPSLSSGTLNAGGTVRGWLTFEVPSTSTNFTLQFIPSWLSTENIEFQLY